jgi:3-hydroxyacyl-CoA dehydrogenase / enoyl-CoA hydratase / 3-hydroxybutyryl-CoA epimerase
LEADEARARVRHTLHLENAEWIVVADGGQTPLPGIEAVANPRAILAFAGRDPTDLADLADRPGRVLGVEFPLLPGSTLVELLRGPETSRDALDRTAAWLARLGYDSVTLAARPRAVVRRILAAIWDEAVRLIGEGAGIEEVDHAAALVGLPMPLRMMDDIGLSVAVGIVPRLGPLLAAGLGADGFYTHPPDNPSMPNVVAQVLLWDARAVSAARDGIDLLEPRPTDPAERLLLRGLNAAAAALGTETVAGVADVDKAAALGAGLLTRAGGPFRWADAQGPASVARRMRVQADAHGPRFLPHPELARRAAAGEHFYESPERLFRAAA